MHACRVPALINTAGVREAAARSRSPINHVDARARRRRHRGPPGRPAGQRPAGGPVAPHVPAGGADGRAVAVLEGPLARGAVPALVHRHRPEARVPGRQGGHPAAPRQRDGGEDAPLGRGAGEVVQARGLRRPRDDERRRRAAGRVPAAHHQHAALRGGGRGQVDPARAPGPRAGDFADAIVSELPVLEDLRLEECDYYFTRIASTSLQNLAIHNCAASVQVVDVDVLAIAAPRLASLRIHGNPPPVASECEMPSLLAASLEHPAGFVSLLGSLRHATNLRLYRFSTKALLDDADGEEPGGFPEFRNLSALVLDGCDVGVYCQEVKVSILFNCFLIIF
ncbi:hypothetical protein PVAP13_7NG196389 [Panicum virgatum]|uniref:Uncharacterized protein n=1 Tax=Panicum virgatum TaxID=38727 RepID=A0A8T0PV88_PANVG|nr:hypothetical protein PVAP13_7NG196389 [Panicum virgatum]